MWLVATTSVVQLAQRLKSSLRHYGEAANALWRTGREQRLAAVAGQEIP